jgi:hypothetical protein
MAEMAALKVGSSISAGAHNNLMFRQVEVGEKGCFPFCIFSASCKGEMFTVFCSALTVADLMVFLFMETAVWMICPLVKLVNINNRNVSCAKLPDRNFLEISFIWSVLVNICKLILKSLI